MRRLALFALVATLYACGSKTVFVSVPPRMDLQRYETVGIVEFESNSGRAIGARAARQFQEEIQSAQPGTRFIELGDRDAVLAAVGGTQLDVAAFRRIREKYGVAAVFVGEIAYSEPTMDVKIRDLSRLEGGVRAEVKGDISSRLVETATGASVWSRSAWARRNISSLQVSAEHGISGGMKDSNPREVMLPALVRELTHDFRPTSQRQSAR